jgi:transaldolase
MRLFADTADQGELEYCFSRGVSDGITTNPKIMEMAGISDFDAACARLLKKYPNVPVSLETDLRGIDVPKLEQVPAEEVRDVLLTQAYKISKLGPNVVIKIPFCRGGLMATRALSNRGIRTNVTATMNSSQALMATGAGATYANIFVNRRIDEEILRLSGEDPTIILSDHPNWKARVKQAGPKYKEHAWDIVLDEIAYTAQRLSGTETELIAASIRDPSDLYRIAKAGPQVITIPTDILKRTEDVPGLRRMVVEKSGDVGPNNGTIYNNKMTRRTLLDFEEAADNAYRGE